jgi:hypothetical protein
MANGGVKKWRIPTIDEARTLATKCGSIGAGGSCSVSESCRDYSESCYQSSFCSLEGSCESDLNDFGMMLSSTYYDGGDINGSWSVDYDNNALTLVETPYWTASTSIFRCVLDETIPNPTEFPYTDGNGLVWSRLHSYIEKLSWKEAAKYCLTLEEGGSNNWRVPTIDELRTLVQGCETTKTGGSCGLTDAQPDFEISGGNCECPSDVKGGYSAFAETERFWSSTVSQTNTYYPLTTLDFFNASLSRSGKDDSDRSANLRCVRTATDPVQRPEIEYPYLKDTYYWSEKSAEKYDYQTMNDYCSSLGGNWSVPSISQLRGLLRNCEGQNSCNIPPSANGGSSYCGCTPDFTGHSILGDIDVLCSSTTLTGGNGQPRFECLDFMTGEVKVFNQEYSSGSGYIRCVRSSLNY